MFAMGLRARAEGRGQSGGVGWFSFCHIDSRVQAQVVRLGSKFLPTASRCWPTK